MGLHVIILMNVELPEKLREHYFMFVVVALQKRQKQLSVLLRFTQMISLHCPLLALWLHCVIKTEMLSFITDVSFLLEHAITCSLYQLISVYELPSCAFGLD
jgi:hypothetical protein